MCKLFVYLDRYKVLHLLFGTSIKYYRSPLSRVSALYWYYKNTVLRFLWYRFVFIQFILKVYIYLPCIKTQKQAASSFGDTPIISSSDHQKTGLYQGSANSCEGDRNSELICLLQKSQAIHYCNQSVLSIVPDLKILVFSITIVDLIYRIALVQL